jgi:cytochrome c
MLRTVLLALLLITASAPAFAQPDSAAAGKDAFDNEFKCGNCHQPDDFEQAPPLAGVVGRKIAGAPDWPYCAPFKARAGVWDEAGLDAFLADTQAFAPGCAMAYKIADPAKRQALIAYLKTLH